MKHKPKPKHQHSLVQRFGLYAAIATLVLGGFGLLFLQNNLFAPANLKPQISQDQQERGSSVLEGMELNTFEKKRIDELIGFSQWLTANNAQGYIGEVGWPGNRADSDAWNTLAQKWFAVADEQRLWSSAWATGSWWGDYPLAIYNVGPSERTLRSSNKQAEVLEKKFANSMAVGTNLAGLEFGVEDGFSNKNPGKYGQTYFSESPTNIRFLKDRGVRQLRLPFRWERLQPNLSGDLSPVYVSYIRSTLDAAAENDMKVVLDLHNYGEYITPGSTYKLGTAQLPSSALSDVWMRLSAEFKDHPALLAYGIMNEPRDLRGVNGKSPAKVWELASQDTLSSLRARGDTTLIMVGGYEWSKLSRWSSNHPVGWIKDPANNFRYEAHHYWDSDASGRYQNSYEQEKIQ